MTACCSSDVAIHLHCAHTHRMLQAMVHAMHYKTWKFGKRCWSHSFIAFTRVSGRSSGGRSWNTTFHLVISISTSSGEGRSPMYISTTSWMLVCDPSAQRTDGTRPRIRRAAALTARGENQLSKSLTMWSKNGITQLYAGITVVKFPPWRYSYAVAFCPCMSVGGMAVFRLGHAILNACWYTFSNPFSTPARSAL